MNISIKPENISRQLIEYREPCDLSPDVSKASENLLALVTKINSICEDNSIDVVVEKNMIDQIIDTLKKLESEQKWLQEKVETETIQSSVLRHKLVDLPRDIEGELRDAIMSARSSNDATIKTYKDQLAETEENIEFLQKKLEVLLVSNVTLDPEKEEMQLKHKEMVNSLNQTLLEKASMQIKLNETRDKFRETIKRTKDFEEAFSVLKDDMQNEREVTIVEEERIKSQIDETRLKIENQRKTNAIKQQEVDDSLSKMSTQEAEIGRKKESIELIKEKCSHLYETTMQLSDQFERECKENSSLLELGIQYRDEHAKLIERYAEEKKKLEKDISTLLSELTMAKNEYDSLQTQKVRAMNLLDATLLAGRKDKDESEDMQKRNVKDDLLHQTSECTRLKRENTDIEIAIEKLKQDHIATSEILSKQIQDYQNSLSSERAGRQQLQLVRDSVNKETNDYFNEYNRIVAISTKSINEGKATHQIQSKRGKELQTSFKEAEQQIQKKQDELMQSKQRFIKMQKNLKGKVNTLQSSIDNLEGELTQRTSVYEKNLPRFLELKEHHKKKTEDFEAMKKHIVDVKTKKSKLETTVLEKQNKLEKLDGPKAKVHADLGEARRQYLKKIDEENKEIRSVEKEIHDAAQQLEAINAQNSRFKNAIDNFHSDIEFMKCRINTMKEGKRTVDLTIGEYRDWLELQWQDHMSLDKKHHDEDILLLDDIKRIENVTSAREKRVEVIHGKLEEQLNILTQFIENVSSLRVDECSSK